MLPDPAVDVAAFVLVLTAVALNALIPCVSSSMFENVPVGSCFVKSVGRWSGLLLQSGATKSRITFVRLAPLSHAGMNFGVGAGVGGDGVGLTITGGAQPVKYGCGPVVGPSVG